ncbi:MAG TPA: dienelactone hydrolase family protein [Azoarcus sp.]|nr:dienelactone hydrolase family protein [Azoarcus sp.]
MKDVQADFDSLLPATRMDRRSFVTTIAAAGFALAVQPVAAQNVITTDADKLDVGTVGLDVKGDELPFYYARPAGKENLPTVLVVQEIFGVHEHIKDVCRRLAHLGYLAIAPELFFRHGNPHNMENVADILQSIVPKVPDAEVLTDLDACAEWAAENGGDPERLAITGFCWGGRIVWLYAAHNPDLQAGVAWYGRLDGVPTGLQPQHPVDIAEQLQAPVLGLYAGNDQGIPMHDVELMNDELERAGAQAEIHVYPNVPHAFHADYRSSYRQPEAEDGWRRMQAWLKRHGV